MKIYFLNRYYFPDASPTSLLLQDVASLASEAGHDVMVITSRQLYDNASACLSGKETRNGVRILRIPTTAFGRAGLLGRTMDYFSFHVAVFLALVTHARKGDVVVAKTDPPLISVSAALAAGIRGAKLVNWLQDIFPEIAMSVDVIHGKIWAHVLASLRDRSLRAATTNIVIDEDMKETIIRRGIDASKIAVIHNWADGNGLKPIDHSRNSLKSEWGIGSKFVVGYSGNLGRIYDFDMILDAARLLASDTDIVFLITGDGTAKVQIINRCRTMNLNNVILKPLQPLESLSFSLSVPDVHVIPLKRGITGLAMPSKFYSLIAVGRPVFFCGESTGAISRLITSSEIGYSILPGDVDDLVGRILELKSNPQILIRMGHSARRVFDMRFDRKIALGRWRTLIETIFSNESGRTGG